MSADWDHWKESDCYKNPLQCSTCWPHRCQRTSNQENQSLKDFSFLPILQHIPLSTFSVPVKHFIRSNSLKNWYKQDWKARTVGGGQALSPKLCECDWWMLGLFMETIPEKSFFYTCQCQAPTKNVWCVHKRTASFWFEMNTNHCSLFLNQVLLLIWNFLYNF